MKFLSLLFVVAAVADPSKTIVGNALATPSLSTLVKVLSSPSYAPILQTLNSPGNFTVFAPNNRAFTAAQVDATNVDMVTQVLMYHVLPAAFKSTDLSALQFPHTLLNDSRFVSLGGMAQVLGISKDSTGVNINFGIPGMANMTAHVVTADVVCTNGVVHIIDRVLSFPMATSATAQAAGLTELVAALQKAGLVNAVDQTPSVTIFAPNNAAMQAAGWNSLDTATLQSVLSYHVVPGTAYSTNLMDSQQFKTLQAQNVTVHINSQNQGVQINNANVVLANVLVRNGVVHVIDTVLMPPSAKPGKGKAGKGKNGKAKGKKGKMMQGNMQGNMMQANTMQGNMQG